MWLSLSAPNPLDSLHNSRPLLSMAAAAAAHLRLHSPLVPGLQIPPIKSRFLPLFQVRRIPNPSYASGALPSPGSEEQRWLREEQRWLREEQRWLREEARWAAERESLLREISVLRHRSDVPVQVVKDVPTAVPQTVLAEHADVKEMLFEEVRLEDGGATERAVERRTLRTGMEGEEVREMQDGVNGTIVTSITEIMESVQTDVHASGDAEDDESHHKVYLLGENRWEDPSRLTRRNNPTIASKAVSSATCLSCRGEGRVMCTECDGTGEPNIEPQFLEWVGEETKCPYCGGLGHTACDVCNGNGIARL